MTKIPKDIKDYHSQFDKETVKILEKLYTVISSSLKKSENKIWYSSPVWFIDGNPIVGYWVRKNGVGLLFWSGQSFEEAGLKKEGKFKAAEKIYKDISEVKITELKKWLTKSKKIQWDYKNIVKNKGKLNKIGSW